jgi:hypothetical protein
MKDSAGIFSRGFRVAALAALMTASACAKAKKTTDVAQDSILVKDADVSGNKTDTAGAATAALVRERGSAAELPALTSGAPVTKSTGVAPTIPATTVAPPTSRTARSTTVQPTMEPPKKVYPSPVLPPRESTSSMQHGSVITSPTSPPPVAQPISPSPRPVTQPTPPPPKKDSTDSVRAGTGKP